MFSFHSIKQINPFLIFIHNLPFTVGRIVPMNTFCNRVKEGYLTRKYMSMMANLSCQHNKATKNVISDDRTINDLPYVAYIYPYRIVSIINP